MLPGIGQSSWTEVAEAEYHGEFVNFDPMIARPKPVQKPHPPILKAQTRLCARYRRLTAVGKKRPLVIAAIAREMAAFLWAIAQHVAPAA